MANLKISQLPLYTGNTYNGYFVWNDSGETTTYRTLYQPQFIKGTGFRSIISNYYNTSTAPNDYDAIIAGSGNTITATRAGNFIFGGFDNLIATPNGGFGSAIISSYSSTLSNGGYGSVIVGGYDNTLSNAGNWGAGMIGGENNTISNVRSGFMGGGNGNSLGSALYSASVGGQSNQINGSNAVGIGGNNNQVLNLANGFFIGGNNNVVQGDNASSYGIVGGNQNRIYTNSGTGLIIVGGVQNKYANYAPTAGDNRSSYGGIYNGLQNKITDGTDNGIGAAAFPMIFGGKLNLIYSDFLTSYLTNYPTIINGDNNTISGGTGTTIIGCSNVKIADADRVVILGVENFSATTTPNTTYVDNIEVINKVVLRDYIDLDYADDTAAAAGGIVLGGVYHTSGVLKIRIT
jgi:hypothetical protein